MRAPADCAGMSVDHLDGVRLGCMNSIAIETVLAARTYLYRAFQATFGDEPTESFFETVFSEVTDQALDCFGGAGSVSYEAAADAFCEVRRSYEADGSAWVASAKQTYTRLLVGPEDLKAPPWECVYLTKERVLFQEATLQVREAYRSENMLPAHYPHVSDDHFAIELDFMAKLSEKSQAAFESCDNGEYRRLLVSQQAFLEEHLLRWAADYASDVAEAAPGSFYACMGSLCAAFLAIDVEVIGELLEESAAE